jgi:hypothetical protein
MNIDLNLNNYSNHDIEKLFGLTYGYLESDVDKKESELSTKLTKFQVNLKTKQEISNFLKSAKERLFETKVNSFTMINPIERRSITRLVSVDTTFRPQYLYTKSSDFIYACPEYIKNVTSLKISSIEIPNSWYVFSDTALNNKFYITLGTTTTTITITEGNYSAPDIADAVLVAQDSNGTTISVPNSISILVDLYSGKTTISGTAIFSLDFGVTGLLLQQTAGWSLGFRKQLYEGATSYTSEGEYGSSFDNYFFVDVDDYHSNFLTDAVVSVTQGLNGTPFYLGNTIMAKIPITTNSNTIVFNNGSDMLFKTREYFGPVKLERLRIRLLNKFGNVIDMNNNDYSIAFEIKETYA